MASGPPPPDDDPPEGEPSENPEQEQAEVLEAIAQEIQDPQRRGLLIREIRSRHVTVEIDSPLPPPQWLDGYNRVMPNGAERVVAMAESQAKHRQWLEKWGLVFAFLVVFLVIGGGIALIFDGKSVEGLIALVAGVGGPAGLFVYRRQRAGRRRRRRRWRSAGRGIGAVSNVRYGARRS